MDSMSLTEIMRQVQALSLQERKELVKMLVDSLVSDNPENRHSILELAGLGAEIWEGIDAQDYVNDLRREWDDRP